MNKIINSIVLAIFLLSFASATIVVNQQPEKIYNLGDTIKLPIKITTVTDISEALIMSLICNGLETEVYKEYFVLTAGEEKQRSPSIPLIKDFIGRSTGTCKIKSHLGEGFELSEEFRISNKINIALKKPESEYSPKETIIIEGDAIKENGKPVQGFIKVNLNNNLSDSEVLDTVNNGYFYAEIHLPSDAKSGEYFVNIEIYEQNSKEEKTNTGLESFKFNIKQIPTSLEIIFENQEIKPGENMKVKAILHDQTGEKIESSSIITLKNEHNEILEQSEKKFEEYLEYKIPDSEPPAEWMVVAVSSKLNSESTFKIIEKKDVQIELINQTLIIKNIGNVLYNDSVLIKIGEDDLALEVTLDVEEIQEFELTAPKGEYEVNILAEGEESITQNVLLTGRAIGIKDVSQGAFKIIKHPVAWIFMISILGLVIFITLKKDYKMHLIKYIKSKKKIQNTSKQQHEKRFKSLLNFKNSKEKKLFEENKNTAELSLSIQGHKQNASIICIKIKNFEKINISGIEETMQKINKLAEEYNAGIYLNQDNIIFILAPIKTKTFKNEKNAIEISQKIKQILDSHNRIFKHKIDFGISANYGAIITKLEKRILRFMSLGAIINSSKKIASIANNEILLDENIKNKLNLDIKTEKEEIKGIFVYRIKEIKKRQENKKFLNDFMNRMREENK